MLIKNQSLLLQMKGRIESSKLNIRTEKIFSNYTIYGASKQHTREGHKFVSAEKTCFEVMRSEVPLFML